jgi:hypothetical protein
VKVFLDCEFTQLNAQAKLISLALVAEGGKEFYVELTDSYQPVDCSEFVTKHVLPQLDMTRYGCTTVEAQRRLAEFLAGLQANVEICSDAPDWDWEFFCDLAYVRGRWPANVSNRPVNLIEAYLASGASDKDPDFPELPHHALKDAKILSAIYKEIWQIS